MKYEKKTKSKFSSPKKCFAFRPKGDEKGERESESQREEKSRGGNDLFGGWRIRARILLELSEGINLPPSIADLVERGFWQGGAATPGSRKKNTCLQDARGKEVGVPRMASHSYLALLASLVTLFPPLATNYSRARQNYSTFSQDSCLTEQFLVRENDLFFLSFFRSLGIGEIEVGNVNSPDDINSSSSWFYICPICTI